MGGSQFNIYLVKSKIDIHQKTNLQDDIEQRKQILEEMESGVFDVSSFPVMTESGEISNDQETDINVMQVSESEIHVQ